MVGNQATLVTALRCLRVCVITRPKSGVTEALLRRTTGAVLRLGTTCGARVDLLIQLHARLARARRTTTFGTRGRSSDDCFGGGLWSCKENVNSLSVYWRGWCTKIGIYFQRDARAHAQNVSRTQEKLLSHITNATPECSDLHFAVTCTRTRSKAKK